MHGGVEGQDPVQVAGSNRCMCLRLEPCSHACLVQSIACFAMLLMLDDARACISLSSSAN